MTDLARLTGGQMPYWFTNCTDTIMTTFTIPSNTGMGEMIHLPTVRGMAKITSLVGNNMVG
jgi:hypothetical protein